VRKVGEEEGKKHKNTVIEQIKFKNNHCWALTSSFCALEYWRPQALQRVLGPWGPDLHSGVVFEPQEVQHLPVLTGGGRLYALRCGLWVKASASAEDLLWWDLLWRTLMTPCSILNDVDSDDSEAEEDCDSEPESEGEREREDECRGEGEELRRLLLLLLLLLLAAAAARRVAVGSRSLMGRG